MGTEGLGTRDWGLRDWGLRDLGLGTRFLASHSCDRSRGQPAVVVLKRFNYLGDWSLNDGDDKLKTSDAILLAFSAEVFVGVRHFQVKIATR